MERIWTEVRQSLVLGLVMPVLVVTAMGRLSQTAFGEMPRFTRKSFDSGVTVQVLEGETLRVLPMDAYLQRVVLGEMPASFEPEALKAQAVAARTYTCRALEGEKHNGAICTDSSCCQAFCGDTLYDSQSGETLEKIQAAVQETDGLVLTYGGALIEATYFSCSGGRTEDAVAVWGIDYPYLRSVSSPGEEGAAYDRDSVTYSRTELEEILEITLPEDREKWIGAASFTQGDGVETMVLGDKIFSGVYLRQALGLRSTAFTATLEGDGIRFDTRGYGHRVGMSQYGANAMAAAGATFREILEHYYSGTCLLNYGEFVEK